MYEVIVDRVESDEPCEYQEGSTFYLKTMAELTDFLEICYRTKNREYVLVRIIEDK